MELPLIIDNAVTQLSRIPGVGKKTALRQILSICQWRPTELLELSQSLQGLSQLKACRFCRTYADEDICVICSNEERRERKFVCVVENISDCMAIERSRTFDGVYFVLGGVLNPLMGIGPNELAIDGLFQRISEDQIDEVLLAINPSVEGDATCSFIKNQIPDSIKVDRIGFGVPIGGNLEYLDAQTISKALENRRQF